MLTVHATVFAPWDRFACKFMRIAVPNVLAHSGSCDSSTRHWPLGAHKAKHDDGRQVDGTRCAPGKGRSGCRSGSPAAPMQGLLPREH